MSDRQEETHQRWLDQLNPWGKTHREAIDDLMAETLPDDVPSLHALVRQYRLLVYHQDLSGT